MYKKKNNLQRILYLTTLGILLLLCTISVLAILIKNKQGRVFRETTRSQLNQSIGLFIDIKEAVLKNTLQDYTFWDEMVDFVNKPDTVWAELNLDPALSTFKFHAFWIFDTTGTKVYSFHDEDYPNLKDLPLSAEIFKDLYKKRYIHTHIFSEGRVIEFLGSTIHPTNDPDKLTSPKGYLFFARVWTNKFIKEFSEVTATQIDVSGQITKTVQKDNSFIYINKPLKTFENKTAAFINIKQEISAFSVFQRFSNILIIILIFCSGLILFTILYASTRYVNKPLQIIEIALANDNPENIDKLKNYSDEFSAIGKLITKFIEQKKELVIAKNRAEESERLKSAFFANVSHEIRSPLNGIVGFSDLIANTNLDKEKTQRFAKYINKGSMDLLRILNDILDFSRIEAKQLEIIPSIFNIHQIFEELEEKYEIHGDNTEIKVAFHRGPDIEMNTDSLRLKQILINLIDNAIKFTSKGVIEIGYEVFNKEIEFYVKDMGVGIPEDKIEIIFDRFRQINETSTRRHGGSGLGLAICKGLVTLMNGDVWVASKEGQGSTFYIRLPLNVP